MIRTNLCDLLNIDVPVFCAPMGPNITSPELAAAVSNAGGLGLISFGGNPPAELRQLIRRVRELTDRPFGINFIVSLAEDEQIALCVEEEVPVLSFFWGDSSPYVEQAHAAGLKVIDQVGSVEAARRSARAGVDVIIAQGVEAGGHVAGSVATTVLVPSVVDAVAPVPVAAAGGIADGRGLVAALALGAEAVVLGTRLLATPEAFAHPVYKQYVEDASEEETVYTMLFGGMWPDAAHRALRTPFVEQWIEHEELGQQQRPDEPVLGQTRFGGQDVPVQRFAALPPTLETSGDVEAMCMLAGQSVGLVHEIKPAATIVRELMEDAERIIEQQLYGALRHERRAPTPDGVGHSAPQQSQQARPFPFSLNRPA